MDGRHFHLLIPGKDLFTHLFLTIQCSLTSINIARFMRYEKIRITLETQEREWF